MHWFRDVGSAALHAWPRLLICLVTVACSDSSYKHARDHRLEAEITAFYVSAESVLALRSTSSGQAIDSYCVLEPYEDRLTDADNSMVPANNFLKYVGLMPEEDYWHVVVSAGGTFSLLRLNQRSVPLATPKSQYMKSSCVRAPVIMFTKSQDSNSNLVLIKIGT